MDFQCKNPRFFFGRKKNSDFQYKNPRFFFYGRKKKSRLFQCKNPKIFFGRKKKLGFSVQKSEIFFLAEKNNWGFQCKNPSFFLFKENIMLVLYKPRSFRKPKNLFFLIITMFISTFKALRNIIKTQVQYSPA